MPLVMARTLRPASLARWRRRAILRMERSRAATLALLKRLPHEELMSCKTQGEWSIKDVLSHIAAWEEEGTERLKLIARDQGHRMVFYETMADADRFNARAVAAARSTSFTGVLRRLARVRRGLVAALLRLPAKSLNDPTHELPVVVWLREFAWTHEEAHRREIRAWWLSRRPERARRA